MAHNLSLHRQNVSTINRLRARPCVVRHICEHAEDMVEVANWRWAGGVFWSKPRELPTPDCWRRISRIFPPSSAAVVPDRRASDSGADGLVMASAVILADVRSRFLGPHRSGTRSPPRGLWSEYPSLMDMNAGIAFCRFECLGLIHVKPKSVKPRILVSRRGHERGGRS